MRNFKHTDASDYDRVVKERIITGRLTPKRYKALTRYARLFNRKTAYPYGISPNGYAYGCGCSHDCCGCLCGEGMSVEVVKQANSEIHEIKLTHSQSFNY